MQLTIGKGFIALSNVFMSDSLGCKTNRMVAVLLLQQSDSLKSLFLGNKLFHITYFLRFHLQLSALKTTSKFNKEAHYVKTTYGLADNPCCKCQPSANVQLHAIVLTLCDSNVKEQLTNLWEIIFKESFGWENQKQLNRILLKGILLEDNYRIF